MWLKHFANLKYVLVLSKYSQSNTQQLGNLIKKLFQGKILITIYPNGSIDHFTPKELLSVTVALQIKPSTKSGWFKAGEGSGSWLSTKVARLDRSDIDSFIAVGPWTNLTIFS